MLRRYTIALLCFASLVSSTCRWVQYPALRLGATHGLDRHASLCDLCLETRALRIMRSVACSTMRILSKVMSTPLHSRADCLLRYCVLLPLHIAVTKQSRCRCASAMLPGCCPDGPCSSPSTAVPTLSCELRYVESLSRRLRRGLVAPEVVAVVGCCSAWAEHSSWSVRTAVKCVLVRRPKASWQGLHHFVALRHGALRAMF